MITILKTEDVAKLFNVHPATVTIWALQGKIRGKRIGKRWFFTEEAIQNALETR